ncbi:MAG: excinuclease ABC subunit UvrA [Candidatus Jordarchaeum sp.]|uniref:excinuclease ABC subunit UvrA n=1 Tax=Candidatus Jordarchaeum sp. TaxID=2823881 RepID=UPI00404B36A5
MAKDKIFVKGASEHNLKNIDVEIPRDKLVVITGLSGSGKSSLAFDTIYAEGQRRYIESLSSYARQFLEMMEKPSVEYIEGLSPAISIEQKSPSRNPRSTVGTITEIYDYLRLLYARIGVPHCWQCGKEITQLTTEQIVDRIMSLPQGTRIQILAPIVKGRKGEYRKVLENLKNDGFARIRIDGEMRDLEEEIILDKNKKHDIDLIVDRLVIGPDIQKTLNDSVETCLKFGDVVKVLIDDDKQNIYSKRLACEECGLGLEELTPQMFSFNNPHGACSYCGGLGTTRRIDPDLVIPNKELSLAEGAIAAWNDPIGSWYFRRLEALAKHYGFSVYTPIKELTQKQLNVILYGTNDRVKYLYENRDRGLYLEYEGSFEGVVNNLERRYRETKSEYIREEIEKFMDMNPCPHCKGNRLKPESLAVTVGGLNIAQVTKMSIEQALKFFNQLQLTDREMQIAEKVLKEIKSRLKFLMNVGLNYITMDRAAGTLSGGEAQRIRLATQIGSSLVGVIYILDEPSIALHYRDKKRLIETLKELRDLGNTIIVVEHDEDTIRAADYIVDLGPGAGRNGGWVVAVGTPEKIMANENSITGQYLSGKLRIPIPIQRRNGNGAYLILRGAQQNNLKNIDVKFPLGLFICITGVSGSGKSSLVYETLYKALAQKFYRSLEKPGKHDKIEGLENIDKVIMIDQSPIGRTPRSNPATYTNLFTPIREVFSMVPEARMRGYRPGRFSFNVRGGRCEACEGNGTIKIEMQFLPDVYIRCENCKGKRFNRETLEIRYKGKNIHEILEMTVDEALEFFENIPKIKKKLQTLKDVGLGYIQLGQPAPTLSGGEAQRVKLSKELSKQSTGRTLYILDEPTTGLATADIQQLLNVLGKLVDSGNTVIVIEHNLDVIKVADHIIDLGPEGGDEGGEIVCEGTPEEVASIRNSYTGQALKRVLGVEARGAAG